LSFSIKAQKRTL